MLDVETKARIDSARDILVGKVPDPKSQVEQITIALIYKFMDDMDRQSEEINGKATFFSGEFKKYRWANLIDKRFGGHERLLLYAEGIEKMNVNKNIPPLFRDIFKGVFLPYRDPETLNLFLKEINSFTYDHSERLGDAFEYLLSVLGTQGDAGQFRTPRHIIDFIVAVVDPKKNETVLDPACGTAGFLISAFKHILKTNENLTPDERARLMTNFRGYDIAPDMVRLSRANLYLHGFPNPVIHEYDTLTSEERWDERCDVILANPPFMTPKGGIRPHNRFSIKANRSEVLFVDYIAEHLNPSGRAGVIVPEGIIFQSQNAYKSLRKMLIENYLWAVVSLPAGVFNPYSGVKTSILFLDRNLARRTDEVLFVKVENDGFDLGAQRKPIEKNDLPGAFKVLLSRRSGLAPKSSDTLDSPVKPGNAKFLLSHLVVSRKRLMESGDVNLSGDRYRETTAMQSRWPMVRLGEVCEINPKKSEVSSLDMNLSVSFVPMEDVGMVQYITPQKEKPLGEVYKGYTYFRDNDVLIAKVTPCFENGKSGIVRYLKNGIGFGSSELHVIRPSKKLLSEFIYPFVTSDQFRRDGKIKMTGTGGLQRVPSAHVSNFEIPLPPLEIQQQMVAELDGYRKVIEGARQILASYKPTIKIDPKWPTVQIGDVCVLQNGRSFKPTDWEKAEAGGMPIIRIQNLNDPYADFNYFSGKIDERLIVRRGDLLFSWSGSRGTSFGPHIWYGGDAILNQHIFKVIHKKSTSRIFLYWMLKKAVVQVEENLHGGVGLVHITKGNLERIPIPLPPLATQSQIVAELEAERELVESNRKLVEIFEKKIQTKLTEIWEEGGTDNAR